MNTIDIYIVKLVIRMLEKFIEFIIFSFVLLIVLSYPIITYLKYKLKNKPIIETKSNEAQNNKKTIIQFYIALQDRNYKKVRELFHKDVEIDLPLFGKIEAKRSLLGLEVMFKTVPKEFLLISSDIKVNDNCGTAKYFNKYSLFSKNTFLGKIKLKSSKIKSTFEFKDGKIYRYTESNDPIENYGFLGAFRKSDSFGLKEKAIKINNKRLDTLLK